MADDLTAETAATAPAKPDADRLLGFYDRLRGRIETAVERRGGRRGSSTARALLLVPDIFLLLVRLALDKQVPAATRATIASVLAYFILPADLLPEAILGGVGFLDDLVIASAVLARSFSDELEPYARKHWSGSEELREVLREVTESARSLLGGRLFKQVEKRLPGGPTH